MNQEKQQSINRQIAEQAAEWLDTLQTAGPQAQSAFAAWVAESPRHLEEFLFISALDSELDRLDPQRQRSVTALVAAAKSKVVALDGAAVRPINTKGWIAAPARWAAGIAAIGIVALLAYLLLHGDSGYTTAIGEQRTIELADGSVLQLNSKSRIETKLDETGRDIDLVQGEAMFKVAPDPVRPFRVHAGLTTIQAIGTQFNVNQRPSGITVSVIEGRVRISGDRPVELGAGEEARVGRAGRVERRGNIDPLSVSAWRQHRLVFRDDTLEDIVTEFNRYNLNSQIRVEGDTLLSRRYTAVFDANDPASLISFLRQDDKLSIDSQGSNVVVRPNGTY